MDDKKKIQGQMVLKKFTDSSLLLSPKADTSANNVDVGSQELPNFLYGQ